MNNIIFTILQALISLAIILTMRYFIPWLKFKLRNAVDETVFNEISKMVKSVEQSIKGSGLGKTKKEEVIVKITSWANQHGISITQEQLSDLIETAVWIMNNEDKINE